MKNTDIFYRNAKEYQSRRKDIIDEYEQRVNFLRDMVGSKYYTDEMKKAADTRDNKINALKEQYSVSFDGVLKAMYDTNHARKMKAPTDDELRIIQLLKMHEKPTEQELITAANTLKDNPACLSVLKEIAKKAGYYTITHGFDATAKELSIDEIDNIIKDLKSHLIDFMSYDTKKSSRRIQQYVSDHYGNAPDAPALAKRPLFEDKAGCFLEVCGIDGNTLTAFENAVDGE